MPGQDAIEIEGRIVALLPRTLFEVELSNGHRVLGHVGRAGREAALGWQVGDTVRLAMSLYDFSKGRIMGKTKECEV